MVYCSFPATSAIKVASSVSTKVYSVAWQPGRGDLLACATSRGGKIINMEQPETEVVQLGTDKMTYVAWSPAGDLLVTLGEENIVWNSHGTRMATLLGQPGGRADAQFNVSGRLVAVSHENLALDVFNTVTGVLQQSVEHGLLKQSLVWKDELEFFCPGGVGRINHWRIGQAEPLQFMSCQGLGITTMAFNPEKDILAAGDYDGTVQLWSEGVTVLNGHTDIVFEVVWKSNDSGILASYSYDGQVRIWDAIAETNLHICQGVNFSAMKHMPVDMIHMSQISFSPDWRFFAAAGCGQNVKVVEVSTGETVAECVEKGIGVSWSKESNKIAVKTIQVQEAASVYNLERVMEIKLKTLSMKCVASLLEKNLTKDEAEKFLGDKIPTHLVSGVCMYINYIDSESEPEGDLCDEEEDSLDGLFASDSDIELDGDEYSNYSNYW